MRPRGEPWVAVTSGDRGDGNGTVTLRVLANEGAAERTAVLTIAGQPFSMTQSARLASTLCLYTIAPARGCRRADRGCGSAGIGGNDGRLHMARGNRHAVDYDHVCD